jgi:general nucleoside transport system permease protein
MNLSFSIIDAAIRLTVPLLLVALGELIAQRSGVINIGIEGKMSAGAYVGFLIMAATGDASIACAGAMVAGMSVSSVMAGVSIWGGVNQILTGFALFVMVPAMTAFLYQQNMTSLQVTPPLPLLAVPLLSDIPVLGKLLFNQNAFYYAAIVLCVAVWLLLNRTRYGLSLTACGQDPDVAASKGLSVNWIRSSATLLCGAFAGLAGAALTVGALGQFSPGVTGGRGFIAIATVILGRWRLAGVVFAAVAIGFTDAAQLRLASLVHVSSQLMAMIPWVVVLMMLIAGARTSKMPRWLGRNFIPARTA